MKSKATLIVFCACVCVVASQTCDKKSYDELVSCVTSFSAIKDYTGDNSQIKCDGAKSFLTCLKMNSMCYDKKWDHLKAAAENIVWNAPCVNVQHSSDSSVRLSTVYTTFVLAVVTYISI